jgi:type I restriction enzyme S subunit
MSVFPQKALNQSWQKCRLGDVLTLINGRAYSKHEERDSGTPVLRIQNLNGGDRWFYSDLTLPASKYCENGDLLFAWSATFGPYIFGGSKSIYHYHIWKVICGPLLDKQFAFYLLQEITEAVKSAGRGISMLHMTKSGMEDWEVNIPPLEEQKRIAAILAQADELRRKRQRARDRLNQLGQAIFIEMFGDQDQHPLTEISDFAEVKGGKRLPKGSEYAHQPTPHPYIRVSDLNGIGINYQDIKYISPETHAAVRRYVVNSSDVIISIAGTIGATATVPLSLDGANLTENAAKITPKPGMQFSPTYVAWALRMPSARSQILASTGQVTIGKLALFRIEKIALPMPDLQTQLRFERIIETLDEEIARHNQCRHRTDRLFASLQHRAFRGELTTSNLKEAAA